VKLTVGTTTTTTEMRTKMTKAILMSKQMTVVEVIFMPTNIIV